MDKIVISPNEIVEVKDVPAASPPPAGFQPQLASPIPWWGRLLMAPLVLVLPVLCFIAIILRVAFRSQPPRTRYAWTGFLTTLLIISGFVTSAATVLIFSFAPVPPIVSTGLSELDERADFPSLPAKAVLSGTEAAQELKSLVAVISPAAGTILGKREAPSNSFGAGMLLQANSSGYLFATARHVVGESGGDSGKKSPRALVSLASGVWASADVIARHASLDLALVWLPRHSGQGKFLQPVAVAKEGSSILVIGHPEGLKFTISTGIVSRLANNVLQISAPISPGNSGGPVYDQEGNLVGIVNATTDKSMLPNAENLNFAVNAQALTRDGGWDFAPGGRQHFDDFLKARASAAEAGASPQNPDSHKLPGDTAQHAHN